MKKQLIVSVIFLFIINQMFAITWDEPWRKEILQEAEYFVFGKVIHSTDSVITVQIEKSFGSSLDGEIKIDDYFMLDLCSRSSGDRIEFYFKENEECYFFLKKGDNGNYQLPTPTSGVDRIVRDKVYSIYRHSYHQAALKPVIYELTYKAIWSHYRKIDYNKTDVLEFIQNTIKKKPAGLDKDEIGTFFEQHAALETAYLLGINLKFGILEKFINSVNFHLQISGLRAMGVLNSSESKEFLIKYIAKSKAEVFNKVIAIWSLWEFGNKKTRKKILKLKKKVSNKDTGFGGNLMDSRICTYFPSPKQAIIDLEKKRKYLWF